jgi:hypothetical protein
MRMKFSSSMLMVAIAVAAVSAVILPPISRASAQAPADSGAPAPALKTPWGEPDLQGIWTDETDTPLQRPPKYANQEFFTDAQRASSRSRPNCAATAPRRNSQWIGAIRERRARLWARLDQLTRSPGGRSVPSA